MVEQGRTGPAEPMKVSVIGLGLSFGPPGHFENISRGHPYTMSPSKDAKPMSATQVQKALVFIELVCASWIDSTTRLKSPQVQDLGIRINVGIQLQHECVLLEASRLRSHAASCELTPA